jgi:hypothetical protein
MRRLLVPALALLLAGAAGCRCGADRPAAGAGAGAGSQVIAELPPGAPEEFTMAERGAGAAYVAKEGEKFRVVHNGRAGKPYDEVAGLTVSPDGRRFAHAARLADGWHVVVDGQESEPFEEVANLDLGPEGAHAAWQARVAGGWHVVVDGVRGPGTSARYLDLRLGRGAVALVEPLGDGDGRFVVADLALREFRMLVPRVTFATLDPGGTRAGVVSVGEGGQRPVSLALSGPPDARRGPAFDAVHSLAFGPDGVTLAFMAERGGEILVGMADREEALPAGDSLVSLPEVRPDGGAVAAVVVSSDGVHVREYLSQPRRSVPAGGSAEGLAYSPDGARLAWAAEREGGWVAVVDGKDGPRFDRVVSPMFSPDGRHLVYRARKDGKRFVVVAAAASGEIVRKHPAYEQAFPVRFTEEGRGVAYGVKDGSTLAWKVEPLP